MVTIDYLLTTVGKTKQELKEIVSGLNIKGKIFIGNQGSETEEVINDKFYNCDVTIFNIPGYGVSKNRNRLLKEASGEYVTFLDDDMYFEKDIQSYIECVVDSNRHNAVRFNVVSDNENRPIKTLNKRGFVGFRPLSSFGVWGCFYNRSFLLKNGIFFNEKIGPGTDINHGEDGVFNKKFTKHSKIYCLPQVAFHAKQCDSTWHDGNRDLENELVSHGYNYHLLYGKKAQVMSILFLLTHMKCYPKGTRYLEMRKFMKRGIKKAKEESQ